MFELRVEVEFSAAHHLDGYPGDCQRPHGHNWVVEVFARSRNLDSIGLAVDFKTLKSAVRELVEPWDHQDLNLLEDFRARNPSAEQIAKLVYERLQGLWAANEASGRASEKELTRRTWIHRVVVWENDRCSAAYFEEEATGHGGSGNVRA